MKEDNIDTLRQQDTNLRDAIRLEEEALPPMPADLNARLMKRVEEERAKVIAKKRRTRVLWPLVAAACVAALIAVFLTPPKGTERPSTQPSSMMGKEKTMPGTGVAQVETPQIVPTPSEEKVVEQPKVKRPVVKPTQPLLAQEKPVEKDMATEEATTEPIVENTATEPPHTEMATVTLTERDIPITRPENYHYTPEEIALLKKQANEAYLKWVELELEISKYTLEKMAQK